MNNRLWVRVALLSLAIACLSTVSAFADADNECRTLESIEYSSVGMVQDKLYFLGDGLYCFEMADSQLVEKLDESVSSVGLGGADFMIVSGGNAPHILDVNSGDMYVWENGAGRWLTKLKSDIFEAGDNGEKRRIIMPTISRSEHGDVLYLLASRIDQPVLYTLEYFNLSNGGAGRVALEDVVMLTDHGDGKIIALIGKPDFYRLVMIDTAANSVGDTIFEDRKPQYTVTGLAYDPSTDMIVMATGDRVYQIKDQAMVDLYAYLPNLEGREYRNDFHCFINGQYVFINNSAFCPIALGFEDRKPVLRFANSGMTDEIRGFMKENPDINVAYNDDYVWDNQTIIRSLLTQSSDVDIITIYAGTGLSAIKAKKYYADLSESSVLTDAVERMYPQIADTLLDDGRLAAFPSDMGVSCWLVDDADLNKLGFSMEGCTIGKWLDFVEEYAQEFDADESSYALFPQGFNKEQLVWELLTEYIIESETRGEMRFDDQNIINILSRVLRLPKHIFLPNNDEGQAPGSYDAGLPPLFVVNTRLSPNAYIGFYEDYHPSYSAPPSFFGEVVTRGTLSVYLVNPYTQHKDAAIAFLEYCAQNQTSIRRFYLETAYDQPIPNLEFVAYKAEVEAAIADLESRLGSAAPEMQADIKAEIEAQKIGLEYAEKNEWLVSDADIAAFKTMIPALTFMPHSLCFNDSSYSTTNINLIELIQKIMQKGADLTKLLSETQRKYEMIQMETR